MRKLILTLIIGLFAFSVQGQRSPNDEAFSYGGDKGFHVGQISVSAGIGAGNFLNFIINKGAGYVKLESSIKPILFIKGEYAVHKNIGVGLNFSHNGFDVGYRLPDTIQSFSNKVPVEVSVNYRSWSIMPRVNFHITPERAIDVYAGFGIGYRHNTFKFSDNDPGKDWDLPLGFVPSVGADFTLGARGYLTPNIGLYAEFGMAKAITQGGLVIAF